MRKVIFKLLIVIMMFVPFMVNAEIKSENLLEALKSEGILIIVKMIRIKYQFTYLEQRVNKRV